jgi:DNA polymerase I-like protein with 3'-5' exonuclease and polymerase domains
MTIINADAKSLEVVCAAYLSQDKILKDELWNRLDIHSLNQEIFNLPKGKEGRLIAKILIFRILYGGTEYSFAQDSNFIEVSSSISYWKNVIDKFYNKYIGIHNWHTNIIQEVTRTGKLVMPTGREYNYTQTVRGDWPITQIKNFPVQGFGADLMAIVRVAFYKRFKKRGINGLVISSVHDSIVVDAPQESVDEIVALFHEVFNDGPRLYYQWFGQKFDLPLSCEVSVGPNMNDLEEVKYAN